MPLTKPHSAPVASPASTPSGTGSSQNVMNTPVITADSVITVPDRQVNAAGDDDKGDAQRQHAVDGRRQQNAHDVVDRHESRATQARTRRTGRSARRTPASAARRPSGMQRCSWSRLSLWSFCVSIVRRSPLAETRSAPLAMHALRHDAALRRLHDLFLRGLGAVQLAGDAALAHHDDAMAHAQDLGQFRRDHDDRLALLRQIVQQAVDLALRAHVNAAGRLVEDQDVGVDRQPLADDHLLLVAARKVLDLLLQARAS